jgi:hypothetical protein
MGILFDIVSAQPTGFFSAIAMKIALAYFSLTLTLNLLLTLMICLRIWGYQRLIRESLGADYGKQYTSITTMFIESAALYTAVSIAVLATFATGSTLSQIFLGIAPCCQVRRLLLHVTGMYSCVVCVDDLQLFHHLACRKRTRLDSRHSHESPERLAVYGIYQGKQAT